MNNKIIINKRRGFTIIELAIVMVIIGLLISGLLVAQSMIETSRISKFVKDIQSYDIAIENFKSKYMVLPGDSTKFGGTGDNDGVVGNAYNGGMLGGWNNETSRVWLELGMDGFMPQVSFVDTVAGHLSHSGNPRNTPSVALSDVAAVALSTLDGLANLAGVMWNPRHEYIFGDFFSITSVSNLSALNWDASCNWEVCGIFSEELYKAVDIKMDDGVLNLGNVRATRYSNVTFPTYTHCRSSAGCAVGGSSSCLCSMYIRPLTQVGDAE